MEQLLPRLVARQVSELLRVMPAVVLTGARQTGKSTLMRELTPGDRRYHSLDDIDVIDLARRDPEALIGGDQPVSIDEIQHEPELLRAIKRSIDLRREPGRFLITGSANLLLLKSASESLAGRATYLVLHPMTRREQLGLGAAGIWASLLSTPANRWIELLAEHDTVPDDWQDLARRGGFPTPALHLRDERQRRIWFDGYVRTYLERDLRDLSSVASLPDFRRLMRIACHRLGGLVNQTDLGRDAGLSQPTAHRYLNLLETSHLLVRLPAFAVNRTKRLIKAPKLYWGDTGVAMHLAETTEPAGCHLENIVLNDLLAFRDSRIERTEVSYWRTATGEEVDFVIEADDRIIPVEVKATTRPRISDTTHLRAFRTEYGPKATTGLLIHTGTALEYLTQDVIAVPWWRVV